MKKTDLSLRANFNNLFNSNSKSERIFTFHLKKMEINRVLDVGSNIGQFAKCIRGLGFSGYIYSIEPNKVAHKKLVEQTKTDHKWTALAKQGVGKEKDILELNIAYNSYSSSFLPVHKNHIQAAPRVQTESRERVQVNSTSRVMNHKSLSEVEALKIDVQGFESEVLQGFLDYLPGIRLLLTELSLVECYEGAPDMFDLDRYIVNELGFQRISLEPAFYDDTQGIVQQYDGIYYKPDAEPHQLSNNIDNVGIVTSSPGGMIRKSTNNYDVGEMWERKCLSSWRNISESIYSISEKSTGSTINWVKTEKKPSINEIYRKMLALEHDNFILTNADICLDEKLGAILPELDNNVIYLINRRDITIESKGNGLYSVLTNKPYDVGIDTFLINRDFVSFVVENNIWSEDFVIGETWWDYLLPITAIAFGYPCKQLPLESTFAMHLKHDLSNQHGKWESNGASFVKTLMKIRQHSMCIIEPDLLSIVDKCPKDINEITSFDLIQVADSVRNLIYAK